MMIDPFKVNYPIPSWISEIYSDPNDLETFNRILEALVKRTTTKTIHSEYSVKDVQRFITHAIYCNPLLYYLESFNHRIENGKTVIRFHYMPSKQRKELQEAITCRTTGLYHYLGIEDCETDLEKEIRVNEWLVQKCEYCKEGDFRIRHDIRGILLENKGVCISYAQTASLLLNCFGVKCYVVQGYMKNAQTKHDIPGYDEIEYSERMGPCENTCEQKEIYPTINMLEEEPQAGHETHAWNYVRVDGKMRHLDCTFNSGGVFSKHRYFNLTTGEIAKERTINFGPRRECVLCV